MKNLNLNYFYSIYHFYSFTATEDSDTIHSKNKIIKKIQNKIKFPQLFKVGYIFFVLQIFLKIFKFLRKIY